MKFSYNWIRDLVDGLDCAPEQLEKLITMKTAECEGIERSGELLENACVARVESVAPIAGSHNVRALVDAGRRGKVEVVCGAPNCRAGLLTAYVPLGSKVIDGVESHGMLASGAELGVNRDHAGVIELDAPVGGPIPGCRPDSVFEIDNKSITHRPDLWGHLGMAREVAAILGLKRKEPVNLGLLPGGPAAVEIHIAEFALCPRYSALVFENIVVRPSPPWLQARMTAIGLNPINNIVDVTNFIMAELAQPMHAFDADLLRGGAIFVRPAVAGEPFTALNEESYTLTPANLVIADAGGAIALGGVIGGMGSAIGPRTRRVVLESANFQASSIRKTSSAIKLRTDASMRFEKAQDPQNTVRGLARAVELLREVAPEARLVGGLADERREAPAPAPIALPLDWLERRLGRAIAPAEVRRILEGLEFGVAESQPRVFSVAVPSWRATKDVSIKEDLLEEVGRMVGYDSIKPAAPLVAGTTPPANPERDFQHGVRELFAGLGFTEVYNYSFLGEDDARAFGFDPASHVRVSNPIASDQALLRTSLVPGIRRNVVENSKRRDSFRLFEIGVEIHALPQSLPDEVPHLMAALYERQGDGVAGLAELRRAAECLMPGAEAWPVEARAFEHPARSAEIRWRGVALGRVFELHPSLVESGRAAVLDLNLRLVQKHSPGVVKYTPIRRYPSSAFDLSVVTGARELVGALKSALMEFAGPLVESIDFVRQYSGPPLEEGRKSVSFRVTVGSAERTLSSEETTEIRTRMINGMKARGFDLRV
ncbi:MAG TPA: phenylalanine--tRNA ligase subunit beta [Bryobacteraceae bacterium]|nr:phenylalanine--tRNA ligase subunit beta [Bryobacteraceae bacterium]